LLFSKVELKKRGYFGCKMSSDISNFKKTIDITMSLFRDVDPGFFSSPYSLISLISQILGLNTPSMGSGDSPYSITSYIFKLEDKIHLFRQAFAIPLVEKRKIVDEIYEMIAPSLLHEQDKYIELLVNTKYKPRLGNSEREKKKLKKILNEKFAILSPFVSQFNNKNGDFGYIVHYGYPEDLHKEHGFLQRLPASISEKWKDYSFPIVNEIIFRNFPRYGSKTKRIAKGWVIFIANHTKELLENYKLRKKKILQAARLAEKLGAKIIGMGGLIASFAQGGKWLSEQIKDIGFTTGHAYTIGNILEIMDNCIKKVGLNIEQATVAIVGAGGSIGSGCAKLLAERKPKHIFLIDVNSFNVQEKMEILKGVLKKNNSQLRITLSTQLADIKEAEIIIVATNSPASLIKSEYLKKGAIVIDDSFPKNISQKLLQERDDIILLEGGIMQLPLSLDILFARNMPDLMDAPLTRIISCKETYGCFAEILVLALYGHQRNYALGYSDPKLAKDIMARAKKVCFSVAPLQCFDEAVEEERFSKIKRLVELDL
jgi:predicted amino acid dehydrogenase